jgi:hypothetical protein
MSQEAPDKIVRTSSWWSSLRRNRRTSDAIRLGKLALTRREKWHRIKLPEAGTWTLTCEITGPDGLRENQAIVRVICVSASGAEIPLESLTPFGAGGGSGHYRYLETASGNSESRIEFDLPADCQYIQFAIRTWKTDLSPTLNWLKLEGPPATSCAPAHGGLNTTTPATALSKMIEWLQGTARAKYNILGDLPTSTHSQILYEVNSHSLTNQNRWHTVTRPGSGTWRFICEVVGDVGTSQNQALVRLICKDRSGTELPILELTPFQGPGGGQYRYLTTRHGGARTVFDFTLPPESSSLRIAVRRWSNDNTLTLNWLRIERPSAFRATTAVSVDVEALPRRSDTDQVARLIYGRFGDGNEYGIPRICDIFDNHGVKATFYVEYSSCARYGDKAIFETAEYLKRRGHDIQLHLHPDIWMRATGRLAETDATPGFDSLDVSIAKEAISFGVGKYKQNLGVQPRIFRPGGMRHSAAMYQAAGELNIEAVSAIYRNANSKIWPDICDHPVLQWDNGIKELPLDFGFDPLEFWPSFASESASVMLQRTPTPHTSVLLHSTSLLKIDSQTRHFAKYHPEFEAQLISHLSTLAERGEFILEQAVLDEYPNPPVIPISTLYPPR